MNKDELFSKFKECFPNFALFTKEYKKVGSKTISIKLEGKERPLYFLYNNPDNWNFGTKPWRAKPNPIKNNHKSYSENEAIERLKEAIDDYEAATEGQIEGQTELEFLLDKKEAELKERYKNEN